MAQRSYLPRSPRPARAVAFGGTVIPFPGHAGRRSLRSLGRIVGNAAVVLATVLATAIALVALGPRLLPYQAVPVLTGSMEPAIPTGVLAVLLPANGDELAVGDVVTFHHPLDERAYVTHRIVAIEGDGDGRVFVTKGDANAVPDAWRVRASGTGWRYAFGLPVAGGMIAALSSSPARFALFALPLLALAALALFEIWRPRPHEGRSAARAA